MVWELFLIIYCFLIIELAILNILHLSVQVGQIKDITNKAHNAELKLFLEVEFGPVI